MRKSPFIRRHSKTDCDDGYIEVYSTLDMLQMKRRNIYEIMSARREKALGTGKELKRREKERFLSFLLSNHGVFTSKYVHK